MQVGARKRRKITVTRIHGIFMADFGTEQHRNPVGAVANHDISLLDVAIPLAVLADIGAGDPTLQAGARDDVDDAGDGVGTIDRGRAILQHFDAFDGGCRQYGDNGQTAGRNAQTLAIDQNQGPGSAEIAQTDIGAAGCLTSGQW